MHSIKCLYSYIYLPVSTAGSIIGWINCELHCAYLSVCCCLAVIIQLGDDVTKHRVEVPPQAVSIARKASIKKTKKEKKIYIYRPKCE